MNRKKAGVGTYQYILGIFGFIFVMLTFIIMGEIFDGFEIWAVAGASGFDANIFTFFTQLWFWMPVIFLFMFALWGWNALQKRGQFE